MLETWFGSILGTTSASFSVGEYLLCALVSVVLGGVIAGVFMVKSNSTPSFTATLVLLPVAVQTVIALVNGNLGAGVAVAGAFSLVRFRSAPGTAQEITAVFAAMAVGLATGMGYIGAAVLFTLLVAVLELLMAFLLPRERHNGEKQLKITIPENLDYSDIFDDLFAQYTSSHRLVHVRTSDMGSLYKLTYIIVLKDVRQEKALIDALRCRNGNLEISCGRIPDAPEVL